MAKTKVIAEYKVSGFARKKMVTPKTVYNWIERRNAGRDSKGGDFKIKYVDGTPIIMVEEEREIIENDAN